MEPLFSKKVVLITGGAKGIGAGCARIFANEGRAGGVIIIDKDAPSGSQLAETTPNVHFYSCDVCDLDGFRETFEEAVGTLGQLDCLINNVGWHPPHAPISDFTLEGFEHLIRLNLTSSFAGCQFAVPHLRQTKGSIINISSISALVGEKGSSGYSATKAGQIGLTKALAIELAPDIRVNAVAPGSVDTPLMRESLSAFPNPEAALDYETKLQVLRRLAQPEEIGRACLFLASDYASFITGTVLKVDGGTSLCHPRE